MNFLAHLFDYLFGTYERFRNTVIFSIIIAVLIRPEILTILFCRILNVTMPIIQGLLPLAIILFVFYAWFRSFTRR